jgi:alpha-amylase
MFSFRHGAAAALLSASASASDASNPVPGVDSFVHLFEWSWSDVAKECEDWLGPKGFTAVQISPPNDHISGDAWWTRYQPVTYELISRSGDEKAFKDMVNRCNAAGVGIYADGVINHIAASSGTSIAGHSYGNRATPIYSQNDMHHNGGDTGSNCQITDYSDKHNVQYCDLVGLPDLCTSCDYVQKTVANYLNDMGEIGIAGFRVDASKHQDAGELGQLLSRVQSNLYRFHEVIGSAGEAVTPDMYYSIGQVTEFNYARDLAPNIKDEGKLQYLSNFGESWGFMPTKNAVVFIDNHDTQRGEAKITYKDGKIYEMATVFMLAHPYGYPKVMSSYYFSGHDQGPPGSAVHSGNYVNCGGNPSFLSSTANSTDAPWVCEHRWTAVANMVAWRKSAGSAGVNDFQAPGGNTISFCRGSAACIAMNRGSNTWSATVKFSVPAGEYCNVIQSDDVNSCPTINVGSDGSANVQVPPLGSVAVHIGKKKMSNSVIV